MACFLLIPVGPKSLNNASSPFPPQIRKLKVKNMPLVVVIDHLGNDLYEIGRKNYLKKDCK